MGCRSWLAVAALAAATAGCGLGEGETSQGEATLVVTRDYGRERLVTGVSEDPPETETVLRFLDREAEITTRYGGGFVDSIEGIDGAVVGGRSFDWFFYVNGIESPIGSADREVRAGDRVWWDYRDWTTAMRVPAVVGSWPEPFLQASAGTDRLRVTIVCEAPRPLCGRVAARLADEGVEASIEAGAADAKETVRIVVGAWEEIRDDSAVAQLSRGPEISGVFARFGGSEVGTRLLALDRQGEAPLALRARAGLVAAVRGGEDPATWVVTGTDPRGVEAAVELLDEAALADRYAVAVRAGEPIPLPLSPQETE